MGFLGKNSWEGLYGLFFSLKMFFLAALFFLIQPHLRISTEGEVPKFYRSYFYLILVILMSFLLVIFSVFLRYW